MSINDSILIEYIIENLVTKGEKVYYEQFLLLSQCFLITIAADNF